MAIIIVNSDIFSTGAKYIAHQCNGVSTEAKGFAKSIFDLHPYANSYFSRTPDSIPNMGTIEVFGNGLEQRYIINMIAQYYPGKSSIDFDTIKDRKEWFHNCLLEIAKIQNLHSIAFPFRIGCNLGGGDWDWYFNQLAKFEMNVKRKAVVLLYKNESD